MRAETCEAGKAASSVAVAVAALFVDELGVYSEMHGVDVWGRRRDALQYAGPHPVVAHPPCQLWGRGTRSLLAIQPRENKRLCPPCIPV